MDYPKVGIATDAAHSMKNGVTEYQAIDLSTGERFRQPDNQYRRVLGTYGCNKVCDRKRFPAQNYLY